MVQTEHIDQLEDKVYLRTLADKRALVSRISQLEELVERYKADIEGEVRVAFRNVEGLWHGFQSLQRHSTLNDDRLEGVVDATQSAKNDVASLEARLTLLEDIQMQLEDRIDGLERLASPRDRSTSVPRGVSSYTSASKALSEAFDSERRTSCTSRLIGSAFGHHAWTVHVSLLPKASQPFPFEQNTAAYERCVSRGLHRVITIFDKTRSTIVDTISREFEVMLKRRPWMPLVAKICNAQSLAGLPMLRQLPPVYIKEELYDYDFLRTNCATIAEDGRILDLYIAMVDDSFCWSELRRLPPFKAGLEACWEYDPMLDGPRTCDRDANSDDELNSVEPSAGDLVRTWSPTATRCKKRTGSSISRASSSGSIEGDSKRKRIQERQYAETSIERSDRIVEAV